MSLYTEWQELAQKNRSQKDRNAFWKTYFTAETENYRRILSDHETTIQGSIAEISSGFNMEPCVFVGFLDGINSSLNGDELNLDELTMESMIRLDVNFEKLYINMHKAKADWLYNLPEWDNVFTKEKRNEILKSYRKSLMVINEQKIGRNQPCPCGSGKKYKHCCGR